jgi:hypothetical protein
LAKNFVVPWSAQLVAFAILRDSSFFSQGRAQVRDFDSLLENSRDNIPLPYCCVNILKKYFLDGHSIDNAGRALTNMPGHGRKFKARFRHLIDVIEVFDGF